MKLGYPSREFDEAVAAVCDGSASDDQLQALNELLRADRVARDEYILRVELHSRLASTPDLFAGESEPTAVQPAPVSVLEPAGGQRRGNWVMALAAGIALLAMGWWGLRLSQLGERKGATSKAVAMLNRVVEVEWTARDASLRQGAPLEPGWLRLKSGLAQIVFYSGARVVVEGPAEVQLLSAGELVLDRGRLVAEVPPQAKGFRVRTRQMNVTDLGTVFGVAVTSSQAEVHVFKGSVEFEVPTAPKNQSLGGGQGAVADQSGATRLITASRTKFASLFDLQNKSSDAAVLRHEQWRSASSRLDEDPSLLVHFDFEAGNPPDWRLPNASKRQDAAVDATVVGCQWTEGRWPDKRALEFRGVSDRVRLDVAGEYESLTLATWVRVQGLDRQINSLFMSDGFDAGTVHWSIRDDGVMALTAIGPAPRQFQIVTTPPALTLDQFGLWVHLAVTVDGAGRRVVQFVNGSPVDAKTLKASQPYRIGAAEIGNWNARGFPSDDPFHIRNFSGAIDEFCIFSRALSADEIRELYAWGKPQSEAAASRE